MERTYNVKKIASYTANKTIIPNVIIRNATLFGFYKEGYSFRFPNIVSYKKLNTERSD